MAYNIDKNIPALREKLKYNYGMVKSIDSIFMVISPSFGNPPDDSTVIAGVRVMYYDSLYSDQNTTIPSALKKYCDVIAQQMFSDFENPLKNERPESMLHVMDSVMTANGDSNKLIMTSEGQFSGSSGDDNAPKRAAYYPARTAEFFADTCKRTFLSTTWEVDTEVEVNAGNELVLMSINSQAKLLKGCRADTVIYFPNSADDDSVADFVFYNPNDSFYVHQLPTVDDRMPDDTIRVEVFCGDSAALDGKRATVSPLTYNSVVNNWEREYGTDDPDLDVYVKFYPGELDTMPLWVTETALEDSVTLEVEFPHGKWSLISFNIKPQQPDIDSIFYGVRRVR